MTYLIDTHVLIWYLTGSQQLHPRYIEALESRANRILLSKVSLLEITIKVSIGKLSLHRTLPELEQYLQRENIEVLEFGIEDLQTYVELPFFHRDPYDRLIISQALNRALPIITDDHKFQLYPVQLLHTK